MARPRDPETTKKRIRANDLRAAGKTYDQIGKELGISMGYAWTLVTNRRPLRDPGSKTAAQAVALKLWRQNLTYDQIGKRLGITKASVQDRIHRALKKEGLR